MKAELNRKEAEIAIMFLNRVDLKGSEAEPMAFLKSKLTAIRDDRELPDPPGVVDLDGAKGSGKAS